MKVELSKSEINHILNLIWLNEQIGNYVGNYNKFKEIRERVRSKLNIHGLKEK